jgi:hypothetical protein
MIRNIFLMKKEGEEKEGREDCQGLADEMVRDQRLA